MTLRRESIGVFTLAALVFCGCAGAPTRFYTLDPMAPSAGPGGAYAGPTLRVDSVQIPPAYDRTELVREFAAGRMQVGDNDHWAAPLGDLMRAALTQDLAARLPAGSVIFPDAAKPPGSSGLAIDILAISRAGPSVIMDVSWTITPAKSSGHVPVPHLHQGAARVEVAAVGSGLTGTAAELSGLLAETADRISAELKGDAS